MGLVAAAFKENGLAQRTLELALDEYPGLEVHLYVNLIDRYVREIKTYLDDKPSMVQVVKAINYYLFYEQGFSGNDDNYYDPRNSFLNEVLDRKLGVPLLLGVIYIELGRRLGLNIAGLNFPGHFLVRIIEGDCELIVNPYEHGILLNQEDLNSRLQDMYGQSAPTVELSGDMMRVVDDGEILLRILTNLKNIYSSNGNIYKLLTVMDRIITLDPKAPHEILDRAMIYEELDYARQAVLDYKRYLELSPDAEDAEEVQSVIRDLEKRVGYLH